MARFKVNTSNVLSFSIEGKDYCFENGSEAELPETNEYVKDLTVQGILVPVEAEKPTNPSTSTKKN